MIDYDDYPFFANLCDVGFGEIFRIIQFAKCTLNKQKYKFFNHNINLYS